MKRVRISTTVDATKLERARSLVGTTDAQMIDRALEALIVEVNAAAERDALRRLPYDKDRELDLPAATFAGELPYDGEVPREILETARKRRAARHR